MRAAPSVLILTLAIAADLTLAPPAGAALPKEYQSLDYKSIFAKDRQARPARTGSISQPVITTTVSSSPVLVGIVLEDSGPVAMLESPDGSRSVHVRIGDALPGGAGTVRNMNLDHLEYAATADAAPRRIAVGQNLAGAATTLPASTGTADGTGAGATTAPSSTSTDSADGDDLLARLRKRRQQELNR